MNTSDTISQLPIEQLHESPSNPRRTFLAIDELAASIKAEGRVHQPLLVRPRLTNPLRNDLHDGWEVVFGHRRLRAAEAAGLTSGPCMVRPMTDAEVRSAQLAENLQRQDVHAIEEAEGFQALMEHDRITADQLAERLGKSRSYVYGRLKLLQAVPQVRDACLAGKIIPDVALLIARLRTAELQAKALKAIDDDHSQYSRMDDGGKRSFRYLRDLLADRFTLALKGSLFDREDLTLVPVAGACSACPKRTGNAPEFADLAAPERPSHWGGPHTMRDGGPDVCTDPDCFAAKKAAHLQRQAQALAAEGKTVITGAKAKAALDAQGKPKGEFIPADKVPNLVKQAKGKLTVLHVQDPKTGQLVKAVRRADLVAAGLAEKLTGAGVQPSRPAARDYEAERQAQRERCARIRGQRLQLARQVRAAQAGQEPGLVELRLVTMSVLRSCLVGDGREALAELRPDLNEWVMDDDELQARLAQMDAASLTALLLDSVLAEELEPGYHTTEADTPYALASLAEAYGVQPEAAATPSPAAPAANIAQPPRGVKYFDPATGSTWTGRGLQPAWLRAALQGGRSLADFAVQADAGAAVAETAEA